LLLLLVDAAAAAAINQPPKPETTSPILFSEHSRNSKTQPNFVPKTQNQSQ
jgi:hypothetical protein